MVTSGLSACRIVWLACVKSSKLSKNGAENSKRIVLCMARLCELIRGQLALLVQALQRQQPLHQRAWACAGGVNVFLHPARLSLGVIRIQSTADEWRLLHSVEK